MQFSIKYRPSTFASVAGQAVSCKILINSILMNRVPQALLISGLYGSGKTTLARLYAKALNCESFDTDVCCTCLSCLEMEKNTNVSVLEFDAASYGGVDDVRIFEELTKQVIIHKYRVIIIDEAHMLTKQAQAALLKIMEAPPNNVVFILVTTEPHKLQDTVRSRCMTLPLQPISTKDIEQNIKYILECEKLKFTQDFVSNLANVSGSLRDIQQVLDRIVIAAGDNTLDVELLQNVTGLITTSEYGELVDVLDQRHLKFFLEEISRWYYDGQDLQHLFEVGIPNLLRDIIMYLANIPKDEINFLTGISYESFSRNLTMTLDDVRRISNVWGTMIEMMRSTTQPRIVWVVFAVKICDL